MMKVVVICGATAVGKTALSISLAKKFNAEIINADASQFKKDLNIGTAKITNNEMDGVVHHLIDIINPLDEFSIGDFQTIAREKVNEIASKNKNVFIVGGSGLYIDALINNYELNVRKSDHESLENEYKDYSNSELYELLKSLDESLAENTHPNNRKRVLRYIERAKFGSSFEGNKPSPYYDSLILFLNRDRDILYDRINSRTKIMLDNGWIDEVKALKQKNIDVSKIKEIGYDTINDYLDSKITYEEMVDLIQKNTRHYAKRQVTWFKNKTNSIIIDLDNLNLDNLYNLIDKFLKGE